MFCLWLSDPVFLDHIMWLIGRNDLCVKTSITELVFLPKQTKNQNKMMLTQVNNYV